MQKQNHVVSVHGSSRPTNSYELSHWHVHAEATICFLRDRFPGPVIAWTCVIICTVNATVRLVCPSVCPWHRGGLVVAADILLATSYTSYCCATKCQWWTLSRGAVASRSTKAGLEPELRRVRKALDHLATEYSLLCQRVARCFRSYLEVAVVGDARDNASCGRSIKSPDAELGSCMGETNLKTRGQISCLYLALVAVSPMPPAVTTVARNRSLTPKQYPREITVIFPGPRWRADVGSVAPLTMRTLLSFANADHNSPKWIAATMRWQGRTPSLRAPCKIRHGHIPSQPPQPPNPDYDA